MSEEIEKSEQSLQEQYAEQLEKVTALAESATVENVAELEEQMAALDALKGDLEAEEAAKATLDGIKEKIESLIPEEIVEKIEEVVESISEETETTEEAPAEAEKVEEVSAEAEVVPEKVETEKVEEEVTEKVEEIVAEKEAEVITPEIVQDEIVVEAAASTGIVDLTSQSQREFSSRDEMIQTFMRQFDNMSAGADGEVIRIGKVIGSEADVKLEADDRGGNLKALATSQAAMVAEDGSLNASVCQCLSVDLIRGIQSFCNSSSGLFSLPTIAAPRGGIKYELPSNACGIEYETFEWEEACDPAVAEANPDKVCNPIPCGLEEEVVVSAYGWCFEITNAFARFNPEQVDYYLGEAACDFDFRSAQRLLDLVLTHPRLVASACAAKGLNAADELKRILAIKAAKIRKGIRNYSTPLLATAPTSLRWALSNNGTRTAASVLAEISNDLNITFEFVDHWQEIDAEDPCDAYSDTYDILLHVPGVFREVDGGELDFGLVRDSELNKRNKFRLQFERWNAVAFTGPDCSAELCTISGLCFDGREAPRAELAC